MKKYLKLGLVATCVLTLTACANKSENTIQSTEQIKEVEMSKETEKETSANQIVLESLENEFNKDEQIVNITLEKEVVDSESDVPHEVIRIEVSDSETRTFLHEANTAISDGEATEEQIMYVNSIRQIVSDEAKNLANDNDSIQFAYLDGSNDSMLIAYSTKINDIIQIAF